MKKIVSGKELQEKMLESVHLLCDIVKQTLGPKGNNVMIDHSNFSPFITNDGVTIAKNIESEDKTLQAILEIIKEASIKTNEEVGDGTTTTLVLLECLYEKSLEYVNKGVSPMVLKKELDKGLQSVLLELYKKKRKATLEDLKRIACISAGDEELGTLAFQVFQKIKRKEAITITENLENNTYVSYTKGYSCEITVASPYFLRDTNILEYKNAYVLLMNTALTDIEAISFVLNDILSSKKNLVIIANYFEERVVEEVVSLFLTEKLNCCLVKIEEYGSHVYKIMKDLACITNASIIEQERNITSKDLGLTETIVLTKEALRIDFKTNEKTKEYVIKLKKELKEVESELEELFYEKRVAMFLKGTAKIHLSAPTKTECVEKRMRLEDALCALSVSKEGVLLGGGISLFQIANDLKIENENTKIWQETLKMPMRQMLKNAGLDVKNIEQKIKNENFGMVYNISKDIFENSSQTTIIDPFLVIKHALQNANSIAGMLLTTSSLLINEYQNNINKEKEYNNW